MRASAKASTVRASRPLWVAAGCGLSLAALIVAHAQANAPVPPARPGAPPAPVVTAPRVAAPVAPEPSRPPAVPEPAPSVTASISTSPALASGGGGSSVLLPDSSAPEVSAVRDAVGHYRRGDLAAGDRIRARLDGGAGAVLDWAAIRLGGSAVDLDRLAGFLRQHPDWPGATWARRRAEEVLVAERKPAETVRAFFSRERPQTASGKVALAQAFRADGLREDAAVLIRDTWRNENFGRELESRILNDFPEVLDVADHRFRMERLLFKENWEGAKRAADYAGKGYDALVKARSAVVGKAANATKMLDAVPPALRSDTSYLFSRVQFLRRAEKAEEAAEILRAVPRDPDILVDGDEWWVERRMTSRKLLDNGDVKGAYDVVNGHGAEGTDKRIDAEFVSGWIALRFMKDTALAAHHFGRAGDIAATPISIARAGYWQGRTAEAAGAPERARAFYETAARQGITYYGQLAAGKLGIGQLAIRSPVDPESPERLAAARSPATQGVGLLLAAGLREVAMPLIVEMGRRSSNVAEIDAVGDLVLGYRDVRALLVLGKSATQRGLPLDEHAFPTIGIPAFEPIDPKVDPAMVHAIARQESAFDPAAQSSAGARGLMQLMPATAQATARKFGVDFELSRLMDGTYNARLGSAHLGELMDLWKGSYILTFASYNAGPGNVRKWIEAYGDPRKPEVDPVDWVERIPFSETRNYVQRVMENMQVYRRRLGERSALLMESDLKRGSATP